MLSSITNTSCTSEEQIIDTKTNGLISAFGDFDSDRFTDVFFISDRGKSLHLLKSYEKKPEFREMANISCTFNHSSDIIVGVIPGDFNGDAMMDVMVVTQISPDAPQRFNIWIFKGDRATLECNTAKAPLLKEVRSHPLILDYNGDMIADFIVETENCTRELWTYNNKQFTKDCPSSLQLPGNPGNMRFPHSNAFVNIQNCNDGIEVDNFSTDIFISGKTKMEYWFDEGGWSPASTAIISYPDQEKYILGQSLFIDLQTDGCIQHIMPVCEKQRWSSICDPQILWYNFAMKDWVKISNFDDKTSNQTYLYFEEIKTAYGFELPISVRFGDVDGDGFVDLLSVMKSTKDSKTRAVILRNIKDDSLPGGRKFDLFWTSEHLISDNVELASFLDVQENGRLDVIMTTRNATDGYNIIWIRNMLIETSCFLKVLVTTGLCGSGGCPGEKVPYGTNQAGLFVCYETSDMDGKPVKGCSTQLSQSAHFALQMPYSVFGLGETPNFVESVQASIPSGDMKTVRKARWTQIVPDAQVVLIPYPPNETTYWICKLFYTPSSIVFSTLATLGVLCVVLVLIILILHRKEVLEDLAEHEEYKRHWPESRWISFLTTE